MIKKSFKIYISLEHLSKINPEMRKILKIQKASKRKKTRHDLLASNE